MTSPQPYSRDFRVPPNAVTAANITEDMLPPIPPRPVAVNVAVVLLGLCGLSYLTGGLWHTIAELNAGAYPASPASLAPALNPLIVCAAIAALVHFLLRGSHVVVILCLLGTGYASLRVVAIGYWLVKGLYRDGSTQLVTDLALGDPYRIGLSVAVVAVMPVLLLLALPSSRRWSRKAGMIRQIRGFIRKGRPVSRLPYEIFT